jgi:hypothetical protein
MTERQLFVSDPLLQYSRAAEYVNLSLRQFRRVFIDSGVLPIVHVSERRRGVRLSDLNACLKERTAKMAPPIAT